jgi:hypothetical protein
MFDLSSTYIQTHLHTIEIPRDYTTGFKVVTPDIPWRFLANYSAGYWLLSCCFASLCIIRGIPSPARTHEGRRIWQSNPGPAMTGPIEQILPFGKMPIRV